MSHALYMVHCCHDKHIVAMEQAMTLGKNKVPIVFVAMALSRGQTNFAVAVLPKLDKSVPASVHAAVQAIASQDDAVA